MVQRLLPDTNILAQLLREAHTISDECHDIATTCVPENLLKGVMIMVHGRDATAELLAQTEGWQHLAVLQK